MSMARVRIVRKDDTQEVAEQVMTLILRRYKTVRFHREPQDDPWYMEWPADRVWTQEDADFMESLYPDLLAGWNYQEWG
jgi:hypothetical protein